MLNSILIQLLYASQLSYIGAIGLTRISTAFFVRHLTRHYPHVRMSHVLAGVSGGWTVTSILVVAVRPDTTRPWSTLDGTDALVSRINVPSSGSS